MCSMLLHTTGLPQIDVLCAAYSELLHLPEAQAALSGAMAASDSLLTLPPRIATQVEA